MTTQRQSSLFIRQFFLCAFCVAITFSVGSNSQNLPTIGQGVVPASLEKEKRLGQAWLRHYRRQVPIHSDPLLVEYTESLIERISRHNADAGDAFSIVIVKNPRINAFAVPGGVIGVNSGLYQYALSEDQFASVLAHELAHLSQRHYARGVEQQKGQKVISMAALLASLVIAATSGGDVGAAAIQATQAGLIDQQLRFSRNFEEEADRIGMSTLVAAGFDPHGMVEMFEQMQRASRFAAEPPEFLLTHPVTTKRISDAENRARAYPKGMQSSSLEYDLIRARVLFFQEETPQQAINRFQSELRGFSPSQSASHYGLVLALTAAKEYERAFDTLTPLLERHPEQINLIIAKSDIEAGKNNLDGAIKTIVDALKAEPGNYALQFQLSQLYMLKTQYRLAMNVLDQLKQDRPNDPFIYYHLAELSGLSGDILKLHQSRAEYFILYGNFEQAKNQLKNILKKFPDNQFVVVQARQRLKDIEVLEKEMKL
ncbi:MAG: putative Zn-dependent protease [Cellvibrionaceae bacterium]